MNAEQETKPEISGYLKEDPATIQTMFGSIAHKYDRTNAILSFQMHKHWNRKLIKAVIGSKKAPSLLDLCCGTGEIALGYLKKAHAPCQAYLIDFCPEMLAFAKRKSKALQMRANHRISFVNSDVENLPLDSESIHYATMAYGIRNVKTPFNAVREAYRVLKPGGRFGILELTRPANKILRTGHWLYLKTLLPILGKWLTSNQEAYEYLSRSIKTFISSDAVEQCLRECGFQHTEAIPLTGGIATIVAGQKPL